MRLKTARKLVAEYEHAASEAFAQRRACVQDRRCLDYIQAANLYPIDYSGPGSVDWRHGEERIGWSKTLRRRSNIKHYLRHPSWLWRQWQRHREMYLNIGVDAKFCPIPVNQSGMVILGSMTLSEARRRLRTLPAPDCF